MTRLVLLRHGESTWNRENRFSGWTDVDLSDQGKIEAQKAGQVLKAEGYFFDIVYTSVLSPRKFMPERRCLLWPMAIACGRW